MLLYDRMPAIDKLALIYFVEEMRRGRKPTINTRYGHNCAIALSYAKLLLVTQERELPPSVKYITSRGMSYYKYLLKYTTPEALARQLPEDVRKKLGRA